MARMIPSWHLLIVLSCFSLSVYSSEIVHGDDANSEAQSFTFSIGPVQFYRNYGVDNTHFWCTAGAGEAVADNTYALCHAVRGAKQFVPLTPSGSELNGAKILYIALPALSTYGPLPLAVIDGSVKAYYYTDIDGSKNPLRPNVTVIASDDIHDANSQDSNAILGLEYGPLYNETGTNSFTKGKYAFYPVTPNGGGTFGSGNSGIAVAEIMIKNTTEKDENGNDVVTGSVTDLELLNADTSSSSTVGNRAAPFNGSLDSLKITNDVTLSGDIVDVHFAPSMERIYIGVEATSDAAGGTRSIVMGRMVNNKLQLDAIVPTGAISGNTKIVGTADGSTTASAFKINSMTTSTTLNYLIVCGGNGAVSSVGNKVYSLPLVNLAAGSQSIQAWAGSSVHGTLAKYDATPTSITNVSNNNKSKVFVNGRAMITPATAPNDLLDNTSAAALVGAGDLPMDPSTQNISDMFVQNDSVFVAISGDYDGGTTQPGLFESEAIFDQLGRVASWTPWKRVAGTDDQIFKGMIDTQGQSETDQVGTDFWLFSGSDSANVRTVRRTVWGEGSDSLLGPYTSQVNALCRSDDGGVQTIQEFTDETDNTLGIGLNQFSLQVIGGNQRVGFAEMGGADGGGNFKPTKGASFDVDVVDSSDGSLPTATASTRFMTVTGGALTELGVVTSAAIVSNDISGTRHYWLVLGGSGGIAVLADDSGNGWTTPLIGLNAFPANMSFKIIDSDSFVGNLVNSNDTMLVQSINSLRRLVLTPSTIASNSVSKTTISIPSKVTGKPTSRFMAFIASNSNPSVGLLGTTDGLFRSDADMRTVGEDYNGWSEITLREGTPSILQLSELSPTKLASGFGDGGQIYVLGSYRGYNESRVHRLYVSVNGPITDTTVQVIDDMILAGRNTFFTYFGDFRNFFVPDGGVMFHGRSRDTSRKSTLFTMPVNGLLKRGVLPSKRSVPVQTLPEDTLIVNPIMRTTPLGSWIVPGNYGVRVSE